MRNIINCKLLIILIIQIFFNLSFSLENRCRDFISSLKKYNTHTYRGVTYRFKVNIKFTSIFGKPLDSLNITNDSKGMPSILHLTTEDSLIEIIDRDGFLLNDQYDKPYSYRVNLCLYDNDRVELRSRRSNENLVIKIIKDPTSNLYYIDGIVEFFGGAKQVK